MYPSKEQVLASDAVDQNRRVPSASHPLAESELGGESFPSLEIWGVDKRTNYGYNASGLQQIGLLRSADDRVKARERDYKAVTFVLWTPKRSSMGRGSSFSQLFPNHAALISLTVSHKYGLTEFGLAGHPSAGCEA